MRLTELSKCPGCKARVNPAWEACILCKHPLAAKSNIGNKEILSNEIMRRDAGRLISTTQRLSSEGRPYAVKIRSKVLNAEVWVVTHPEAISYVPEGEVYFLPEEIRNFKGANLAEIRMIYQAKKELGSGSILVSVNPLGEVTT